MKVLITGGMGVIGAEASRRFVSEGHRPVLFARHRDDSLISDIADQVDIETGDIVDLDAVRGAIERHGVTHIVHTAAFVGALSAADPPLSIKVNVLGTTNVFEAARLAGVKRVVFTSAKGVYGPITGAYGDPEYRPIPEDMRKEPQRIYDSAKLMGEHIATYYRNTYGVDAVILRFATTYGPGKTARHGKMGVTSSIVETVARGEVFSHPQGAEQKDDFIYNKDSARAIYMACLADHPKHHIFNIGSGVPASLLDFKRILEELVPGARLEIGPGLNYLGSPFPISGIYDVSRAREELGFVPAYDLRAGIADYLVSYRKLSERAM